jgi:hypothetical protein
LAGSGAGQECFDQQSKREQSGKYECLHDASVSLKSLESRQWGFKRLIGCNDKSAAALTLVELVLTLIASSSVYGLLIEDNNKS